MKKLLLTVLAALTILYAQSQQCQADFSYMQNGPTTIFTDLSTINSGWSTNYSISWDWDFGDGNASTQQNPSHTYANNGIYLVCLIVTYNDSTLINSCTSFYCDSIFVGNSIPASWDCSPTNGCYDPGTGLGQYSSFASCDTMCGAPTLSWDCPTNMPGGCYDPGTGNGQYATLAACQSICGTSTPSWDCGAQGCYDPGTGLGQYTSLVACQAICVGTFSNACDSMTLVSTGSSQQTMLVAEVPINFMDIHYWITTAPDGTVLGEDSMWNSHQIYNNMNNSQPYDTINVCITYIDNNTFNTCCVNWIWNSSFWARMGGNVTSIGEIRSFDRKLIKVVDMLGREISINSNQTLFFINDNRTIETKNTPLFYIYDDGTVEKKIILE